MKRLYLIFRIFVFSFGFSLSVFGGLGSGVHEALTKNDAPISDRNAKHGKLKVIVSVDWEGIDLTQTNLDPFLKFRTDYPEIPLVHFLNAAYFTKKNTDAAEITQKINLVLREGDEIGLHIHGWKSLFEAAGVDYKDGPQVLEGSSRNFPGDCGYDVNIGAYDQGELQKVIRYSMNILESYGLGHAKSFRAGYWQGTSSVLNALAAEGIVVDSSAVPPSYFRSDNAPGLNHSIRDLWPAVTPRSQPYIIETPSGPVLEVPNNGMTADAIAEWEMTGLYDQLATELKSDPSQDFYFHIAFHQEAANRSLGKVRYVLEHIKKASQQKQTPVEFTTLPKPLNLD